MGVFWNRRGGVFADSFGQLKFQLFKERFGCFEGYFLLVPERMQFFSDGQGGNDGYGKVCLVGVALLERAHPGVDVGCDLTGGKLSFLVNTQAEVTVQNPYTDRLIHKLSTRIEGSRHPPLHTERLLHVLFVISFQVLVDSFDKAGHPALQRFRAFVEKNRGPLI
jgi:hypothetical protein